MSIFDSILLGIVEGITEFLPISSTGHLILTSSLLGLVQNEFLKTFEVSIQLGAILAVVVLFWKTFLNRDALQKILIAFVPTGVIGIIAYPFVKNYLIGNNAIVLGALFLGGIVLIAFEKLQGKEEDLAPSDPLTYRQAFLVGICQAVALIPGVSRSGATIVGGMLLGVSRSRIVEFSFLLAVPTMLAATGLSILSVPNALSSQEWMLLSVGFIVSFVAALVVIRWFLAFIRKHSFTSFGIYRIVLAIVFALFLL